MNTTRQPGLVRQPPTLPEEYPAGVPALRILRRWWSHRFDINRKCTERWHFARLAPVEDALSLWHATPLLQARCDVYPELKLDLRLVAVLELAGDVVCLFSLDWEAVVQDEPELRDGGKCVPLKLVDREQLALVDDATIAAVRAIIAERGLPAAKSLAAPTVRHLGNACNDVSIAPPVRLTPEFVAESLAERRVSSSVSLGMGTLRVGDRAKVAHLDDLSGQLVATVTAGGGTCASIVVRHLWQAGAGYYALISPQTSDERAAALAIAALEYPGFIRALSAEEYTLASTMLVAALEVRRESWRYQPLPCTVAPWQDQIEAVFAGKPVRLSAVSDIAHTMSLRFSRQYREWIGARQRLEAEEWPASRPGVCVRSTPHLDASSSAELTNLDSSGGRPSPPDPAQPLHDRQRR